MTEMEIVWQRLVTKGGTTCPRCRKTGEEVFRAFDRLQRVLEPLGVILVLKILDLDETTFQEQPAESNRIWVAGKPIEEWINGQTGSSLCCDECGENECRTIDVNGQTYEVIPEDLLVRAGIIAASRMLDSTLPDA